MIILLLLMLLTSIALAIYAFVVIDKSDSQEKDKQNSRNDELLKLQQQTGDLKNQLQNYKNHQKQRLLL